MKAFDKWFSKDGCFIPERGDAGYEGYVERRAAWKAALNWLQIQSDVYIDKYIREYISKELND